MKKLTLDELILRVLARMHPGNEYVREKGFSDLYVRITPRLLEGKTRWTIDLARLTATKPGKGAFTRLVARLRKDHPDMAIYVESVLTSRFADKLARMGFKPAPYSHNSCFYMLPVELSKETQP